MPITRQELKDLSALRTKKGRRAQGLFAAEGIRLLEVALDAGRLPETLYYVPSELKLRGERVLERARAARCSCVRLEPHQLAAAADTETPQGLIATFAVPRTSLAEVSPATHVAILVAESVADPGNLGTLIRSALAFEFSCVVLLGNCVDPHSPKVVRSTAGAIFSLTTVQAETSQTLQFLQAHGYHLVAASGVGKPPEAPPTAQRIAVAIGSEGKGLSQDLIEQSNYIWRIDHSGKIESLNAGMAGSIIMQALYSRRTSSVPPPST
ncbi:MAG: RNA methyltransferase [Planctomycetes bacterium]|nr:RNA methyltransferase [Planctomycetota bacterium]